MITYSTIKLVIRGASRKEGFYFYPYDIIEISRRFFGCESVVVFRDYTENGEFMDKPSWDLYALIVVPSTRLKGGRFRLLDALERVYSLSQLSVDLVPDCHVACAELLEMEGPRYCWKLPEEKENLINSHKDLVWASETELAELLESF